MNLIEGVWGWIQLAVINNVFYPSLNRVRARGQKLIANINMVTTKTIDRLSVRQ